MARTLSQSTTTAVTITTTGILHNNSNLICGMVTRSKHVFIRLELLCNIPVVVIVTAVVVDCDRVRAMCTCTEHSMNA
jgi:hypothetical protein